MRMVTSFDFNDNVYWGLGIVGQVSNLKSSSSGGDLYLCNIRYLALKYD